MDERLRLPKSGAHMELWRLLVKQKVCVSYRLGIIEYCYWIYRTQPMVCDHSWHNGNKTTIIWIKKNEMCKIWCQLTSKCISGCSTSFSFQKTNGKWCRHIQQECTTKKEEPGFYQNSTLIKHLNQHTIDSPTARARGSQNEINMKLQNKEINPLEAQVPTHKIQNCARYN